MQQADKFVCGAFSVVGPVKGKIGRLGHKRLLCDAYRCSRCRPRKLRRVRARIAQIASELKLLRFVTLTLDPKRIPEDVHSDRYLRETWRKMRVLLARRFGASIQFIAVLEFQRSGIAHLHALVGVYIPQDWLSHAWQSVGGGRIVDIRYVDVHRVSAYLTKYLANDKIEHTLDLLPVRARILSSSRSIRFWPKGPPTDWWLVRKPLEVLRNGAEAVSNERWEALEDIKPFGLEMLMYFEARPSPEALADLDFFRFLKALVHAKGAGALQDVS